MTTMFNEGFTVEAYKGRKERERWRGKKGERDEGRD